MKKIFILILTVIINITIVKAQIYSGFEEKEGKLYLDDKLYTGTYEVINNGIILSVFHFKDGVRHGDVTHLFTNQKVKEKGKYLNGNKDGKWERWDENGVKTAEAYYNNGIKTGIWLVWDHNGTKRYEMYYSSGKKTGTWKVWDESGTLTQEKSF